MTLISSETSSPLRPSTRWTPVSSRVLRWSLAATLSCLAMGPAAHAAGSAVGAPAPLPQAPERAQDSVAGAQRPVIAEALASVSEEVQVYNDHLTILASPWMEGRQPGTPGMERAMQYMEYHFQKYGLRAPFPQEVENTNGTIAVEANASFRQPFRLRATSVVKHALLEATGGQGQGGGVSSFEHGAQNDFTVTTLGAGGMVKAPAVFVGYSIARGPNDFSSFPEGLDLKGKIAVMLRFEPIGPNGWSLWRDGAEGWTAATDFTGKLRAAADRGAEGIIIINPPGTPDKRAQRLRRAGGSASSLQDIPVLHMSLDAGRRLIASASADTTLEELRERADEGRFAWELPGQLSIEAKVAKEQTRAENIVAVLPGKGRLAEQYIVVGAHLDHLGMGNFGSRDLANAGRKLHPGADDNASGSAGILLIAEKMAADYAKIEGDLRSIVFIGFSAEESGLHGSEYYVQNPVAPIEKHTLMMNFDMIGRITEKKLSLSGLETGLGLAHFVAPIAKESPLTVVTKGNAKGSSDHTKFEAVGMPVLFAIIENFHDDYHTSRDVSSMINRVDAVHAANLFYGIASAAATRSEPFAFKALSQRPEEEGAEQRQRRVTPRVRLGVSLSRESQLSVTSVASDSTAEEAGVQVGDTILEWNGRPVKNLRRVLRSAKVGDEATLTVLRAGERVVLKPTKLRAAPSSGGGAAPAQGSAPTSNPTAAGGSANSPRAGSRVMFGIRPAYTDEGDGVLAESVTKDSPAADAGLKKGDRVLSWNGEGLEGARALGELLKDAAPGEVIEVLIERDGKEMTKKVTLRARGSGS